MLVIELGDTLSCKHLEIILYINFFMIEEYFQ